MEAARSFAQKMRPGYYVRRLESGEIRTLWVVNNWGDGAVNGYVKKTHPDEYSAVEWLVKHGAELKGDASPEAVAEAEAIRQHYKAVAESAKVTAIALAEQACKDEPESHKGTHTQFGLLEEPLGEEDFSAYEPVAETPPGEAPAETLPSPSGAPELTSQTPPTETQAPCEPAPESGKSCEAV
jgi:hypothetical protein